MKNILAQTTKSAQETENVGKKIGSYLKENNKSEAFLALYGDLGAGKTAFVRGLSEIIAPGSAVCSPTYTVVNEYGEGENKLYHFDMYRINDEDDLYSIGFYDYRGVLACEWCEKIPYAVPDDRIEIRIEKTGENERKITAVDYGEDT